MTSHAVISKRVEVPPIVSKVGGWTIFWRVVITSLLVLNLAMTAYVFNVVYTAVDVLEKFSQQFSTITNSIPTDMNVDPHGFCIGTPCGELGQMPEGYSL